MSPSLSDKNKKKLWFLVLAVGLVITIFVGYRILYMSGISEYAKEFTAGCIGAVITIFATAALLKSQADSEVTRDQLSGIFREKLELYKSFIEFLKDINSDGEVDTNEIKKLVEWGGKLALVCRPMVIRRIYEYAFQLLAFGANEFDELSDREVKVWKKWMLEHYDDMEDEFKDLEFCSSVYSNHALIISSLRDDLTNKKVSDFEEYLDTQETLNELFFLHSAVDIHFENEDDYVVEKFYGEKTT